ncbi:MAG: NADP(H)-dependent aldo-keto reductase [Gammaproteobacteria bacterium]|nr:NADP(H)-dependent aldo-keto reductase [Gammaproteobacteria bacterium]
MEYRTLGRTDLEVSVICLGTMTWGEQNSEVEAHAQLDYALDHGVNFIDAAELYPIPPRAETYGRTETYIGSWLARRGNRDRVVLSTKAAGPGADWIPHIRGGRSRYDAGNLREALEASLRRLGTDYIDLYQLHWPERNTNFFGRLGYEVLPDEAFTPFAETLEALDTLVKEGKIRHFGLSNESAWGAMSYIHAATIGDLPRPASIQNPYSLLNRSFEVGLAEVAHREALALLAYSPLGFGVLTGKYLDGARPAGARISRWPAYARYLGDESVAATRAYVDLARHHGLDPAQLALAYANSRPFLAATIIGATDLDQLATNIGSAGVILSPPVLEAIEAIHKRHPYPAP